MDDKEFLSYFDLLSKRPINEQVKKQIAEIVEKIVKTLVAVSHTKTQTAGSNTKPFLSTLGEKLIEDVDYTFKRCVRGGGQSTDTHVQIHYALVLKSILSKFGGSVNIQALLDSIVEITSKKHALSKSEVKHFSMGRLALIKSIIQSQIIEKHSEDAEHLYTFIFELLQTEMDTFPENALDVCENIFEQKLHQKLKAKLFFSHILKNQIKHHNGVSVRGLIISYFAHKRNNNASFAQQSLLDDKILNFKNLKTVLLDIRESYPQEHTAIDSIVQYLRSIYKKKEQWMDFWKTLLKEFCLGEEEENAESEQKGANYRNYFVIMALFRRFLKSSDFVAGDFSNIQVEELIHLWLRHYNVRNRQMQVFSSKIEKAFNSALQLSQKKQLSGDERKEIVEVIHLMRQKTTFKFTPKQNLPKLIFSFLNEKERQEYLQYIKKQLHKSTNFMNEYMFYLNELYVYADHQFTTQASNFQQEFNEICYLLFENSLSKKLSLLYSKQNAEAKSEISEKQFIERYSDQISQLFSSLLSSTLKLTSPNFKDHKSFIWRGLNDKNELWIFNVLKFIISKTSNFESNPELIETIKQLGQYVKIADSLESTIKSNLQNKQDEEKGFSNKKKRAFCNLLIGVCLMSLHFNEEGLQNLEELKEIYESIETYYDKKLEGQKPKKKVKISSNSGQDVKDEEDAHFIRVLSDLLVSLLTKSVHYMREITNLCFQAFVNEIDQFSLQTLVDVITRPTEDYLNDMAEGEEGNEEEDEEDDDEEENMEEEIEVA